MPRLMVLLFLLAGFDVQLQAQPERGREQYLGFDLELLAEATAQLTTLRTRDGEERGNDAFDQWLGEKGLDRTRTTGLGTPGGSASAPIPPANSRHGSIASIPSTPNCSTTAMLPIVGRNDAKA